MKAVLFDLGNTLVAYYKPADFAPILRESIVGVCGELQRRGYTQDRHQMLERARLLDHEREDHRVWPLADRLRELFGAPATNPVLLPQLTALFLRPILRCARPDPAAVPLLAELRRRGLRTGIVSNTPWGSSGAVWRADLERLGLAAGIDVAVFCTDVGWRKPAPAIFERALLQLGLQASDVLFVGDDPARDVAGALAVGMKAAWLDPSGEGSDIPGAVRIRRLDEVEGLLRND